MPIPRSFGLTRRQFVLSAAALTGWPWQRMLAAEPPRRPRVAAIYTVFHHRSHAHVLLENFLAPYYFNGQLTDPGVEVVSFYADQRAKQGDMTEDVAGQFKVRVCKTIEEALCLGGKELAVDAVLSIGEHGTYPVNKLGQTEYPRKRFFDEIVAVMRRSKRFVPLFSDKHLSYRWDWAKEMVATAKALGIPFMAGSSVPLAQRIPPLELQPGAEIVEAVSIHGGGLESYDFHALEVLQSLVEARKGGESGIARVTFLQGDGLWRAAAGGQWSKDLAEAAMAAELGTNSASLNSAAGVGRAQPHGILLHYHDGLRAMVLKIGSSSTRWNFACRLKNDPKPRAARFYVGPWQNRNLFKALAHAIQQMIHTSRPSYPVERTLLVSGVLDAAMHARAEGKSLATPHLEFTYQPVDFRALRERGASWKIITEDTPELPGINPNGGKKPG
ncbi:MAG TPA: hypothetical protein VKU02_32325 [Gemmataceae bacterium]|nr:hypothetical protein [Gemmataceae bacterium]